MGPLRFDKLRKKLRDQAGDTLVEALTAILIAVLGATLLATMVITSTNVAMSSQQSLDAAYKAEVIVQSGTTTPVDGLVTISKTGETGSSAGIKVRVYEEDGFTRYEL